MKKRILSLDGGGIRIALTINELVRLEAERGVPIASQFDMIAGTSAGAIVAAMLVCPTASGGMRFSALQVKALFESKKDAMFERNPFWFFGIGGVKYRHRKFEALLRELLGALRLSDAITPVMITAYDTQLRQAVFYTSDRNDLLRDAVRASSAAPTYFSPFNGLIDGGIFANNPALCALVEGVKMWHCGIGDIEMLSIGTGKAPISYRKMERWGLFRWIVPLIDTLFSASSETAHYHCQKLLGDCYERIDFQLSKTNID